MRILAVDPGNVLSAYVLYESATGEILEKAKEDNYVVRSRVAESKADRCVIEMVASYGMAVGKDVFETVYWIGRFSEVWDANHTTAHQRMFRKDVKMHICQSMRAKDSNIRQAIIDMYPPVGGGALPQRGTKSNPGPLFGVSSDMWAALGVAITYSETRLSVAA